MKKNGNSTNSNNNNPKSYSEKEFLKEGLGINSSDDLKNEKDKKIKKQASKRLYEMNNDDLKKYINITPQLVEIIKELIITFGYVIKDVNAVRIRRWEIFQVMFESGKYDSKTILEIAKRIENQDIRDRKIIEKIIKMLDRYGDKVLLLIAVLIGGYLGRGGGGKNNG